MIRIKEAIVVEGRYDKNTLSQLIDGTIIETEGFGIFSNKEKLALLRRLAEKRGLLILTDSDGAGFVIRNFLKGALDPKLVKHAYIPDVLGKESRKAAPSKEGKLGVEGMRPGVLLEALRRAGVIAEEGAEAEREEPLITADLYALGLSGGKESGVKRKRLLEKLSLPEKLSPRAMLEVLNALYSREEFFALAKDLDGESPVRS